MRKIIAKCRKPTLGEITRKPKNKERESEKTACFEAIRKTKQLRDILLQTGQDNI